jgi:5-methylcytosine-specific restriction endonuclease McrA
MNAAQLDRRRNYDRLRYPRRRESDLARLAAAYRLNPSAKKLYNKEYNAKNRERIRAQRAEYRKANVRKIVSRNMEYWRKNPEKKREWQRRWNSKNRARISGYDSRRRALELGAKTDRDAVLKFFEWIKNQDFVTCTYCGVFISGKSVEIDHIVPLSRGGEHLPDNFCVSCRTCNASKGDFLLSEWTKCPEKLRFIQV